MVNTKKLVLWYCDRYQCFVSDLKVVKEPLNEPTEKREGTIIADRFIFDINEDTINEIETQTGFKFEKGDNFVELWKAGKYDEAIVEFSK